MKAKRISLESLQRRVDRRALETELALLESQYDFASSLSDPTEAYLDPQTGESWIPLGPATSDTLAAPYRTEAELNQIRRSARITAIKNPYAKNLLNSITAFTVGKGHKYTASPKPDLADEEDAKLIAAKVNRFVQRLLKLNKWFKRQRQSVLRYHRDGETFIRCFYQENGYTLFRFVEPADVYQPAAKSDAANSFGVRTDEDVEDPQGYWVAGEYVPVEEIQHRKANVDMNFKRGLPTLFTVRDHLDRALKLLRNMSVTVANQTAISAIRKHKATKGQVQSFAQRLVTSTRRDRATGQDVNSSKQPIGATLDLVDGKTSYEFPAGGLNAASPVQVLAAELRAIASALSWPEFMIGSDSSNANYSSTMVAENPAVKAIESEQADLIEDDLDLIWAAISHAVQTGYLPPDALTVVEIEVEPPTIVSRDPKAKAETDQILNGLKVKSAKTIASENGLDYKQEQANFTEHDDTQMDAGALDLPPETGATFAAGETDLAKTALNGAQITGLIAILKAAAGGQIPADSVSAIIGASFPNLTAEQVADIVTPLQGFKPKPAPAPAPKIAA